MHPTVLRYVAAKLAERATHHGPLDHRHDVLEVGSYDVNGSVRPLFPTASRYVGVDIVGGPGVDRVYDGLRLPFSASGFDVVVSTEMLEHCARPWRIVAEMARVVRPGGLVILTARGWVVTKRWLDSAGVEVGEVATFGYHNPPDLWRYSGEAMRELALDAGLVVLDVTQDGLVPGWFLTAVKP